MLLRGRELKASGQITEAINIYCDTIRFGDDWIRYSELMEAAMGVSSCEIAYEEIRRLLDDQLSDEQLSLLLGYFRVLDETQPDFANAWVGEQLCSEAGLKKAAEYSGFFTNRSGISWSILGQSSYDWINRTDYIEAWPDVQVLYPELIRINRLPFRQAKEDSVKFEAYGMTLRNRISRAMFPSAIIGLTYDTETRASFRGVYILAALKLYKLRHGAYPETLDKLSPAIIPAVPLDPFSDKPFIYRVDKDGILFLYSVKEDLKDDNADPKKDVVISPKITK
ncbi:MAG: hypothetical protein V1701_04955 [Planctomycetota bacterium]